MATYFNYRLHLDHTNAGSVISEWWKQKMNELLFNFIFHPTRHAPFKQSSKL